MHHVLRCLHPPCLHLLLHSLLRLPLLLLLLLLHILLPLCHLHKL
jgi:hypothetical protein